MTSSDSEKKGAPASYAEFNDPPPAGLLRTVVQFFAIPLLIVLVGVGLFVVVTMLFDTRPTTAMDYVRELRSDTINRRWQAAVELSNRLGDDEIPVEFRDPILIEALTQALADARKEPEEPPMLAVHLLRVLRRLQDARAIAAIRDAADDDHPWIRSHALLVLGGLRDLASLEIIERRLKDEDAECRKAALFALASLDQVKDGPFRLAAGTGERVRVYLGDPDPYVRMQAALLLAQAGVSDGVLPLLAKMLDREYLRDLPFSGDLHGTNRARVNSNLLVQTVLAVSGLDEASGDEEIEAALNRLTDDSIEGDPEVRQQARVALGKLRGSSTG